jgi:hypothetical protein
MQHSRLATDNLRKIIEEENTDILCIQESYTIQNKIAGLSKNYNTFATGEGRNGAAIVVTNSQIDALLFKQHSHENMVVLELILGNVKIILASVYFDINLEIEIDLLKIEPMLLHAKGAGVLIAADSNSRSVSWHDTLTNRRGTILEGFPMSKQIYILKRSANTLPSGVAVALATLI